MPSSATGQDIAVSIRAMMTEAVVIITMTSVITVPLVAAVMIIAITNAQTLAMEDMEDILVVSVEQSRFDGDSEAKIYRHSEVQLGSIKNKPRTHKQKSI